jgi:uncharacterized protein (DUF169 family)
MEATRLELWDRQLQGLTGTQPVGIAFVGKAPSGVARRSSAQPSGCSFWRVAAGGEVFYTESVDHLGCAVGAYTHGVDLPPENMQELSSLVGEMVKLRYLKEEEVAQIPRRPTPFQFAVYSPLGRSPVSPDVVLVWGSARPLMLLAEAGRAAGFMNMGVAMGRPACAMVPQAAASGEVVLSLGCVGNRVYTEIRDDQSYLAIAGRSLAGTMEQLDVIVNANEALEGFHSKRRAELPAS